MLRVCLKKAWLLMLLAPLGWSSSLKIIPMILTAGMISREFPSSSLRWDANFTPLWDSRSLSSAELICKILCPLRSLVVVTGCQGRPCWHCPRKCSFVTMSSQQLSVATMCHSSIHSDMLPSKKVCSTATMCYGKIRLMHVGLQLGHCYWFFEVYLVVTVQCENGCKGQICRYGFFCSAQ